MHASHTRVKALIDSALHWQPILLMVSGAELAYVDYSLHMQTYCNK